MVVPGFTMGSATKCAPYLVSIYQEASILWKLDPNSCFIKIAIEETAQLLKYLLRKCKDLSSLKTQGVQSGWRLTRPHPCMKSPRQPVAAVGGTISLFQG